MTLMYLNICDRETKQRDIVGNDIVSMQKIVFFVGRGLARVARGSDQKTLDSANPLKTICSDWLLS